MFNPAGCGPDFGHEAPSLQDLKAPGVEYLGRSGSGGCCLSIRLNQTATTKAAGTVGAARIARAPG